MDIENKRALLRTARKEYSKVYRQAQLIKAQKDTVDSQLTSTQELIDIQHFLTQLETEKTLRKTYAQYPAHLDFTLSSWQAYCLDLKQNRQDFNYLWPKSSLDSTTLSTQQLEEAIRSLHLELKIEDLNREIEILSTKASNSRKAMDQLNSNQIKLEQLNKDLEEGLKKKIKAAFAATANRTPD